jgi:CheY-like chemotaxis protein
VKLRPPRKPLVLVVDDDAESREALHLVLEEELSCVSSEA